MDPLNVSFNISNYSAPANNVYGTIFWLISKLGPKCRIYNDDKIFITKDAGMDGMKILFTEREYDPSSFKTPNTFTSFSIPQIEQPYKYSDSTEQIMEFLTP